MRMVPLRDYSFVYDIEFVRADGDWVVNYYGKSATRGYPSWRKRWEPVLGRLVRRRASSRQTPAVNA